MKTPLLLIAGTALVLAGCSSTSSTNSAGSPGFEYGTSAGRGQGMENDYGVNDPRGAWENWRYGGDTDRIPPRLPVSKHVTPIDPNYPFERSEQEATAESAKQPAQPPAQLPPQPPAQQPGEAPVFELTP